MEPHWNGCAAVLPNPMQPDLRMISRPLFRWLSAAMVIAIFSSCAAIERRTQAKQHSDEVAEARAAHAAWRAKPDWRKDTYRNEPLLAAATTANSAVEISLSEQRGLLLVDGCIALDFPVATGRSSYPTPAGEFRIRGKEKAYASNLYGKVVDATGVTVVENADRTSEIPEGGAFVGASMPNWMRLTDSGVGMHIGYVPGRPASHGCIRLRRETANRLFGLLEIGSPVVIANEAPALQN